MERLANILSDHSAKTLNTAASFTDSTTEETAAIALGSLVMGTVLEIGTLLNEAGFDMIKELEN